MNRFPASIGVLLLLLVPCGPAAGQATEPAFRMVEAKGQPTRVLTLGLERRSPGQPVVILQSGFGSPMELWGSVPQGVAQFAPVVAYDRPGIGGSPFHGSPPTLDRVTDHLGALLAVLDAPPPYILVGHSWAGPLIQDYAGKHPQDVVGMVFVDPTDWTADGFPVDRAVLANLGFEPAEVASMEAELEAFLDNFYSQAPPGIQAEEQVSQSFMAMSVEERGLPELLPVPTAVLLAGRSEPLPPGAPEFFDERFDRARRVGRISSFREMVLDLPEATLVVATYAGHYVHTDDPGLLVEAIRRVAFPSLAPQLARAVEQGAATDLVDTYKELKARYPAERFNENLLNALGYDLLRGGRVDEAIAVFELNVAEYPSAWNPYDSLGEAYMVKGDREKAVANYRKSLDLNPNNENAARMLERLLGG
ncbi:MAG TPA: alpha/beta fold hydrolase [Gemmatimonadales bacterium]|nr:alpha/beta fold hydrolase [Gemmatimonadales bacterium]